MSNKLNCILLVDDDKATNFLNKRLLTKMGIAYDIQVVRNGVEAMTYLNDAANHLEGFTLPELILLDLNMPLVNGWEFLEQYATLPEAFKNNIHILMLTTSLREADTERAVQMPGIKGLIHKPLKWESMSEMLQANFPWLPTPPPPSATGSFLNGS